jgi:hypothetical protein
MNIPVGTRGGNGALPVAEDRLDHPGGRGPHGRWTRPAPPEPFQVSSVISNDSGSIRFFLHRSVSHGLETLSQPHVEGWIRAVFRALLRFPEGPLSVK